MVLSLWISINILNVPLTPLSELIVFYEPNQDMEMMFNKQLSTSLAKTPTNLLLPKFSHEIKQHSELPKIKDIRPSP